MPRTIDKLPCPSHVRPMKVIGLGASRTGTLGLFQALKVLGFHPFHISELLPYGMKQMRALQEAIIASKGSDSGTDKPFTRREFDKMWGNYDCIIESPCYLGLSGVQVYLADPDVKFILTERTPESFAKSVAGSLGTYNARLGEFPLSFAKYFNSFLWELSRLFRLMTLRWSDGLIDPTTPEFKYALAKNYVKYMADVKALVPPERLLVLNLEKGFGYKEICNFLDVECPDSDYPRSNSMSEFHVAAEMIVTLALNNVIRQLTVSTLAVGVAGIWWWKR